MRLLYKHHYSLFDRTHLHSISVHKMRGVQLYPPLQARHSKNISAAKWEQLLPALKLREGFSDQLFHTSATAFAN